MENEDGLYVVHWKSKLTGIHGHGEPVSRADALATANIRNKEFPNLTYWIEAET